MSSSAARERRPEGGCYGIAKQYAKPNLYTILHGQMLLMLSPHFSNNTDIGNYAAPCHYTYVRTLNDTKCEGSALTISVLRKTVHNSYTNLPNLPLKSKLLYSRMFMHIKEKIPTVTKTCLSALTKGTLLQHEYKITHRPAHTYIHYTVQSSKR